MAIHKPRRQPEEQCEYPDNSKRSISIISAGLEKLANINEKLIDTSSALADTHCNKQHWIQFNSFDGSNRAETTSWFEQIVLLVKRCKESVVEIAMAKLKENPLRVISTLKKETSNITWESLKNTLLKKYSDVPHRSNAMAKCFTI